MWMFILGFISAMFLYTLLGPSKESEESKYVDGWISGYKFGKGK